jgi:pyruvate dehydrogenase E2 component (dihydrolipoamide acetyltransferase)
VVVAERGAPEAPAGRVFASPRARKTAREKGVDLARLSGSGPGSRIVERDVIEYVAARPRVTPVARRTAQVLGVDLEALRGSGPGGRVTKADVEAAVTAPSPPAPAEVPAVEGVPMTGLRRIIAERMAASHAATARVTLVTEAEATAIVEAREQLKASVAEEWGFAPGYNDLLGLIVARALREFPYMNARLGEDGSSIEHLQSVNLGLAVDTKRGLLVPVVRNADQKGLRAIASEFRTLVERARAGRSLPDDLTGGTFTVTNLGMYDVDAFTPIINPPEAAILGAGRIQPKAVVREGEIVSRHMWTLSLTFDHRLVDGAPAARFLQRIKQLIENPYLLLG